jgi:outer membrane protein OmpA-like peptidoglycan-associated protein
MTDFNTPGPSDEERRRAAAAEEERRRAAATPPRGPNNLPPPAGRPGWMKWLLPLLAILLVLFLLSRCLRTDEGAERAEEREEAAAATAAAPATLPPGQTGATLDPATGPAGVSALDPYLAGAEPAGRAFAFERVNFDTGSSSIRRQDVAEIEAVAASLARYPNARIRVQGFADARGDAAANQTLALARANAVKNALAANGADARRIEAVSGGEGNPVGSNASATGQAENRRTELVVVSR